MTKWLGIVGAFAACHLAGMAIGGFCARRRLLGFGRDADGLESDQAKQRELKEWQEPDAGTAQKQTGGRKKAGRTATARKRST